MWGRVRKGFAVSLWPQSFTFKMGANGKGKPAELMLGKSIMGAQWTVRADADQAGALGTPAGCPGRVSVRGGDGAGWCAQSGGQGVPGWQGGLAAS